MVYGFSNTHNAVYARHHFNILDMDEERVKFQIVSSV
jgi:hypothetical protein